MGFHPTAGGDLERSPETGNNSVSFRGDATGFNDPDAGPGATFATPALKDDLVIAGLPKLDLAASVTAPRVHLISTLFDEDAKGERRRIGQFAINPELRNGIARRDAVTPGQRYDMTPPGFAMAHHLRAGHKLVLKVSTSDPDKVPTFANDPKVTVFTGPGATSFTLPVVAGATLSKDDVPLEDAQSIPDGPAQAPFSGSATPVARAPARGRPASTRRSTSSTRSRVTTTRRWSSRPRTERATSTSTSSASRPTARGRTTSPRAARARSAASS